MPEITTAVQQPSGGSAIPVRPAPVIPPQPVTQAAATSAQGSTPASQLAPPAPKLPPAKPLSDLVSPFKVVNPSKPAVEFVPAPPAPPPVAVPPPAAPPPPPTVGDSAMPQVSVQSSGEPVFTHAAQPELPASAPAAAVVASPIPPPHFGQPSVPVVIQPQETTHPDKSVKIYSHNTKVVWKARRSARTWYRAAGIIVALLVVGGVVYWYKLGSPTTLNNALPIQDMLNK